MIAYSIAASTLAQTRARPLEDRTPASNTYRSCFRHWVLISLPTPIYGSTSSASASSFSSLSRVVFDNSLRAASSYGVRTCTFHLHLVYSLLREGRKQCERRSASIDRRVSVKSRDPPNISTSSPTVLRQAKPTLTRAPLCWVDRRPPRLPIVPTGQTNRAFFVQLPSPSAFVRGVGWSFWVTLLSRASRSVRSSGQFACHLPRGLSWSVNHSRPDSYHLS